ncbi:hypothetical protein LJC40_07910, partial [Synergistaceae bacterium OttesenSCG-928-D05]|nr:hypothetical protein [Synergistaceae bacterium OttesenSCG-928-D05]
SFFSKMLIDQEIKISKTSELDSALAGFLPVLFEGKSIKNFNVSKMLQEIERHQSAHNMQIIKLRWEAIRLYFLGKITVAISTLNKSLDLAKKNKIDEWIIQDILIDLRSLSSYSLEKKNQFRLNEKYQKQLEQTQHPVFYPQLDRLAESIYGRVMETTLRENIKSMGTITFGSNLEAYLEDLSQIFLIAACYGSLTHLLQLYDRIKLLTFFWSEIFSNWSLKIALLKNSILASEGKEIDGITKRDTEILARMTADDAASIYKYSENLPVKHRKYIAKMESMRLVGYHMDDAFFDAAWTENLSYIQNWLRSKTRVRVASRHIFGMISGLSLRIDNNKIVEIISETLERKIFFSYDDAFMTISKLSTLDNISECNLRRCMTAIISYIKELDTEKGRRALYLDEALCKIAPYNLPLKDELEKTIREFLPDFYENFYVVASMDYRTQEPVIRINRYVDMINSRNQKLDAGDKKINFYERPHHAIRAILFHSNFMSLDTALLSRILEATAGTLLQDKQPINEKIGAVQLFLCIVKKYPEAQRPHEDILLRIQNEESVFKSHNHLFTTIKDIDLRFAIMLLYSLWNKDVWVEVIDILSTFNNDIESQVRALEMINFYLESSEGKIISAQLESVILQHSLMCCNSENLNLRWFAIRNLLILGLNQINRDVVCKQLIKHIDIDNVYIKNSILRKLKLVNEIDADIYDYIVEKARSDSNFAVRKVLHEVLGKAEAKDN